MYDIVIEGGTIVEPSTAFQTVGNIGIKDGKIAIITREPLEGAEHILAKGKIVCPGFIDIHSHLHYPLYPAWMSAKQGITTALSGNCGITPKIPVKDFLDEIEAQGYPINFATLIGHSWSLREKVGLKTPYETATAEQAAEMARIAE